MSDKQPPTPPGRIVWHDLFTADSTAAAAFYGGLFEWTITEMPMGDGPPYRMLTAGEHGVGGFEAVEASEGKRARWMAYVAVDDVAAACARAEAKQGKVVSPPRPIPGIGVFAVIQDPTGAEIALYKHDTGGVAPPPGPGEFCWEELLTNDVPTARAFYEHVVGWTCDEIDMGPMGIYTRLYSKDGQCVGGMLTLPDDPDCTPHWLPYVMVKDVDAGAAKATTLGAGTCVAPTDIPNVGRFSVHTDPEGADFALYLSAEASAESPAEEA